MAHIQGIGGVFIYANDAQGLAEWYASRFGLEMAYNAVEDSFYTELPGLGGRLTFGIMRARRPLEEHQREFVINYRVSDLAGLIDSLTAAGVTIKRTQEFSHGRFAWLKDPEGNPIELFEPA